MNAFEEYLHSEDLEKRERAQLWRTSIGLQDVDNLRVSNFLIETARKQYRRRHFNGRSKPID